MCGPEYLNLRIEDDFSPKKIAESGQCFRVRQMEDGSWRFITREYVLYLRQEGEIWQADCSRRVWEKVWKPYFDLDTDYRKIRKNIPKSDSFLKKAADYGAGIRILLQDPWEMLVTFIISQRKSIPAIRSVVEQLSRQYGKRLQTERETVYAFPEPSALRKLGLDELRACRLGYRADYVYDAVRAVTDRKLNLNELYDVGDEELLETLMSVKGVGIKVANCISLFAYHRTNLAPVDVWIRKLIDGQYHGKNPFPAYGNAAGIMQQYAFYYAIGHKTKV